MNLYSTIYAVRRNPETYISTVNSLEVKLRAWKEGLPAELVKGDVAMNDQEGRVFALYAQVSALEFRILLRHPSVSMTNDSNFNAESMRICVESARQMLGVVRQLQKFKSLDTTWYNSAVYVMAITTILFAQWERRHETSAADLAALREEMDIWLEIMGDIGSLIGSGTRLREAVRVVTDGTLGLLSRSLPNKNTGYFPSSNAQEELKSPSCRPAPSSANGYPSQPYNFAENNATINGNGNKTTASNYLPAHQHTPYPAATQYSTYPDPTSNSSAISYTPQENHTFTNYPSSTDTVEAPLIATYATRVSQIPPSTWQRPQLHPVNSGSQAWQQWTSTMAGNLEPQDCYSASALMQLGGRDLGHAEAGAQTSSAIADMAVSEQGHLGGQVTGGMGAAWPLNIFDIGQGGAGS